MNLLTLRRAAHASPVAIALLVAANAIPLVGVLFWGWSLPTIVTLYWMENGVVGAFALARIWTARAVASEPGEMSINGPALPKAQLMNPSTARLVLAPFFLLHYGIFWLVHGLFVVVFLPLMWSEMAGSPLDAIDIRAVLLAIPILVLSHGASFVLNWWIGGERFASSPSREMAAPYGRVIVLHLTIVLGAFLVAALGAPIWALVLMVGLKTIADLGGHLAERAKAEGRADAQGVTLQMPGRSISFGAVASGPGTSAATRRDRSQPPPPPR